MSALSLSAATDYHRDKKTQCSPLISSTHTVKLFTGNWVTRELSLCTIYRALVTSCSPLGFTTTTELVAPPGILERTGSERSSLGLAGTSWGLRRVCETSHHLARECRLLPTSLAWLERVRVPLRGKWRRGEGVCAATIGPSPPTASGVERAPLPLPPSRAWASERRFQRDLCGFLVGDSRPRL